VTKANLSIAILSFAFARFCDRGEFVDNYFVVLLSRGSVTKAKFCIFYFAVSIFCRVYEPLGLSIERDISPIFLLYCSLASPPH
jgi:hypothetical protein